MKTLFFTKGDTSVASSNERVWIIADLLKKNYGYDYEIVPAKESRVKKIFSKVLKRDYQLIVVHKSLFPYETILFLIFAKILFRKPLIYDLDDAQWLHSHKKSVLLARFSNAVFAGSHMIVDWAKQYNRNVVWIPTLVDHEHFARQKVLHTKKDTLTIGWVGGGPEHFKTGNLQVVRPALEEFAKRGYRFRFSLVGTRGFKPLEEYFISPLYQLIINSFVPYSEVPKSIHEFDIGIMPLLDIPFERGKCAAKAIQYMACRVPPVVSSVGENVIAVDHEKNGFLAATTEEWVRAFEILAKDPDLRNKMGEAGMEKVKNEYSHEAVLTRYIAALEVLA